MAPTIVEPTAHTDEIEQFAQHLANFGEPPRLVGPGGHAVALPLEIYRILCEVADQLRRGNGVTVMPLSAVLTTAQAAELLNVSRPHVVKLVDAGEIAHHMAGKHRRLRLTDLMAYLAKRDQDRRDALIEMHAIADEAGMDL